MKSQLNDKQPIPPVTKTRRKAELPDPDAKALPALDIFEISGAAFHLNLRRKQNIVFSTSLYEIDKELEERNPTEANDTQGNLEELRKRLLELYRG